MTDGTDAWARLAFVAHRAGVRHEFAAQLAMAVGPGAAAAAIEYARLRLDGEAAPAERAADELSIKLRTLWLRLAKVRAAECTIGPFA
jgi:hypothetical protein